MFFTGKALCAERQNRLFDRVDFAQGRIMTKKL